MAQVTQKEQSLRRWAAILLVGYALQFIAGIVLNLFVQVPAKHSGANATEYFGGALHGLGWALSGGGGWTLAFHAWLAVGLVLGSITLAVASIHARLRRWSVAGTIAALFTIGALFNGLSFINYNHDISSLIMALCWLVAVGSVVYVLGQKR